MRSTVFSRLFPGTTGIAIGLLLVLASSSAISAQYFGKNKVQYREFEWNIYHSPHFDIYYYEDEEELLQKVVSLAESAYDHLSRVMDFRIEEPTTLIFYETHSAFEQNNVIVQFIPEGVGAFATRVRNRMVLPVDLPDEELYRLILHELTHIFQYHILFQGRLGRGLAMNLPTWLMEGMASYYAQDEQTSDKMFLRDAVVNDSVPPITQVNIQGFFAYRFGHAAFDFMEERWGPEGVIDFLYEIRSTIGGRVDKALERAFRITSEDFDADFRRWLRRKYLPQLVETGEPSDFGRRYRRGEKKATLAQHISPVVSPSGDLVVAYGAPRNEIDIILLDTQTRQPFKNLTKGIKSDIQYYSAQFLTSGRRMGRDLTFSPDGNFVAAFAKREAARSLVIVDVLKGGIHRIIDVGVEQAFSPAWSPSGEKIAFAGNAGEGFDLFLLDLETEEVENVTRDERFDGGPIFTRDGSALIYSSVVGMSAKLFRLKLGSGEPPERLTHGDSNDMDPYFSPDGSLLFFTSDQNDFDNIYSMNMETGEVVRYTNAITGAFMPTVLERKDGGLVLIYTGYWRGRFDLYQLELDDPIEEPEVVDQDVRDDPTEPPPFEPEIQVSLDDANDEPYGGWKFFVDDANVGLGVSSDNTILSAATLSMSDYLGDRRLIANFSSVSSFSNFDVVYMDLSKRLQWGAQIYDQRSFYLGYNGAYVSREEQAYSFTGARGFLIYPTSTYHRVEAGLGYQFREYNFQSFIQDPDTGEIIPYIQPRKDNYPEVTAGFVGDTVRWANYGPIAGRRYRLNLSYAPDFDEGGTLTASGLFDGRQYVPLTLRSGLAFRGVVFASFGNFPNIYSFGGLDTLRGYDIYSLTGDRAFFVNMEYRFPLVDALVFPFMTFQGIRGRVFLDVGGAWLDYAGQDFTFWNSEEGRLEDAVSSYGFGISIRFLGIDLHWDFAKRWDFNEALDRGFVTEFWIGPRF